MSTMHEKKIAEAKRASGRPRSNVWEIVPTWKRSSLLALLIAATVGAPFLAFAWFAGVSLFSEANGVRIVSQSLFLIAAVVAAAFVLAKAIDKFVGP